MSDGKEKQIGGVLVYENKGRGRVSGQILGVNGAGKYAVLIYGDPAKAGRIANDHLRDLKDTGHELVNVMFVGGERITWVVHAAQQTKPGLCGLEATGVFIDELLEGNPE